MPIVWRYLDVDGIAIEHSTYVTISVESTAKNRTKQPYYIVLPPIKW